MHADIGGDYTDIPHILKLIRALLELLIVDTAVRHHKISLKVVGSAARVVGILLRQLIEIRSAVQLRHYLLSFGHDLFGGGFPCSVGFCVVAVGAVYLYLGGVGVVEFQQDMLYLTGILRQPVIAVVGI